MAPEYEFPSELFPAHHHIRLSYNKLLPAEARSRVVRLPRDGTLLFDGVDARRPRDRPTLLQMMDASGVVSQTMPLTMDMSLPEYDAKPDGTKTILLASSVATLAAAGGTYAAAWVSRGSFYDDDPSYDLQALESKRRTTNVLSWTSAALLSLSIGTGVSGVALR